ncbi:MAG: Lrp/AsnC family transcriptional regulator [Phycisphaerae bacterium]|nr:Lrp/AsnC family transcriptional regulator [Phycisphaerae bacterium]
MSEPTPIIEPDRLDWRIIRLLQDNGRTPNATIAEQLKVAEGTVRGRIRKLLEAGILRIAGMVNPDVLTGHQLVVVAMNVKESKQLEKTARAVAKLPQVKEVAITSGRYDIMAKVLVDSNKGIIHFLTDSLAKIEGIAGTETFVMLKTYNAWI